MERWDVININVSGTNTLRFNALNESSPGSLLKMTILTVAVYFIVSCRRMSSDSQPRPPAQSCAVECILRVATKNTGVNGLKMSQATAPLLTSSAGRRLSMRVLMATPLSSSTSTLVRHQQPLLRSSPKPKPYLTCINAQQVRGWRTVGNRSQAPLTQVRYHEVVSIPEGQFGEELVEQICVLTPIGYQRWRKQSPRVQANAGWEMVEEGTHTAGEIPFVTVYSNRLATLYSKPPLEEVAHLSVAYAQRFTDYMNSLHVGSMPMLTLKGFDPDIGQESLGLSVNKAILLPPDGEASIVSPPSDSYQEQLRCLTTLEEQISSLGISALAKQNITNTAAESKRLDRIDSDSIMSIISQDLERAVGDILRIAGKYVGKEPPKVTIPKDYENRLLDGNQITAMLQLQMQNQISQSTLLRILKEGEVIPPYVDVDDEILRTKDEMDADLENELREAQAFQELELEAAQENEGGVTSGDAADGSATGSNTLPTPLRPGKHAD